MKSKIKFSSITFLALKNSLFKINTGSKVTQTGFLHNPLSYRDWDPSPMDTWPGGAGVSGRDGGWSSDDRRWVPRRWGGRPGRPSSARSHAPSCHSVRPFQSLGLQQGQCACISEPEEHSAGTLGFTGVKKKNPKTNYKKVTIPATVIGGMYTCLYVHTYLHNWMTP